MCMWVNILVAARRGHQMPWIWSDLWFLNHLHGAGISGGVVSIIRKSKCLYCGWGFLTRWCVSCHQNVGDILIPVLLTGMCFKHLFNENLVFMPHSSMQAHGCATLVNTYAYGRRNIGIHCPKTVFFAFYLLSVKWFWLWRLINLQECVCAVVSICPYTFGFLSPFYKPEY